MRKDSLSVCGCGKCCSVHHGQGRMLVKAPASALPARGFGISALRMGRATKTRIALAGLWAAALAANALQYL